MDRIVKVTDLRKGNQESKLQAVPSPILAYISSLVCMLDVLCGITLRGEFHAQKACSVMMGVNILKYMSFPIHQVVLTK